MNIKIYSFCPSKQILFCGTVRHFEQISKNETFQTHFMTKKLCMYLHIYCMSKHVPLKTREDVYYLVRLMNDILVHRQDTLLYQKTIAALFPFHQNVHTISSMLEHQHHNLVCPHLFRNIKTQKLTIIFIFIWQPILPCTYIYILVQIL